MLFRLAAVLTLFAVSAFTEPCDPRVPGPICQPMWQQALGQLFEAAQQVAWQYGQNLGNEGKAIVAKVQAARAKVAQTNPSSPAFAPAWAELSDALRLKDVWCLKVDTMPDKLIKPFGVSNDLEKAVDGGIRPYAARLWQSWLNEINARTGPQLFGMVFELHPTGRTESMSKAISETLPAYERYRLARDWAESALAGRPLTNDQESFAVRFLAIKQPWSFHTEQSDPNLVDNAKEYYRTMLDVYGRDAVAAAFKRVAAGPIGKDGLMAPPIVLHGFERSDPYDAFTELAEQASPKNYIISVTSKTDSYTIDLRQGQKSYQSMIDTMGEAAVSRAGNRIIAAPKDKDGNLLPGFVVNGREFELIQSAMLDLLGETSPRNYAIVSATRAYTNTIDMRKGDEVCRRFAAAYGEAAVAAAAERVRQAPKDKRNGRVLFPQRLGPVGPNDTPFYVFRDLLEQSGSAKQRLRAVIAFHDKIDSASALDAAYAKFTARYPEAAAGKAIGDLDKLLASTGVPPEFADLQMHRFYRAGDPGDYYAFIIGAIEGTSKIPAPPGGSIVPAPGKPSELVDNPFYQVWAKFKPGAIATYADTDWVLAGGQIQPKPGSDIHVHSYKLLLLDGQGAAVEDGYAMLTRSGRHGQEKQTEQYDARVPKDSMARFNNAESGTDTLEVNGKTYQCRWLRFHDKDAGASSTYTVWYSDAVPGGTVLTQARSGASLKTTVLQPFVVENVYGIDNYQKVYAAVRSLAANSPLIPLEQGAAVTNPGPQNRPAPPAPGRGVPARPNPSTASVPGRLELVTVEPMGWLNVTRGTEFHGRLREPLVYNGKTVLPAGTVVHLKVENVGSSGNQMNLRISVDYAFLGAKRIALATSASEAVITRGPAGRLPAGTPITLTVTAELK